MPQYKENQANENKILIKKEKFEDFETVFC